MTALANRYRENRELKQMLGPSKLPLRSLQALEASPACSCPCHQVERADLRMKVWQKESRPEEGRGSGEPKKVWKPALKL